MFVFISTERQLKMNEHCIFLGFVNIIIGYDFRMLEMLPLLTGEKLMGVIPIKYKRKLSPIAS